MKELEYPTYPLGEGPRLRWSAILAGSAIALAVIVSFNVLGVALGFFPGAAPAAAPAVGLGFSASWWTMGSGVAAHAAGAWFASRLSDCGGRGDGVLYGLVTWAFSTLAAVYVPAFALGGGIGLAGPGAIAFGTIALQAVAAALGGMAGARLYLPVPITEFRRAHREGARR